jgi:transcription initiation factor TFIIIB Brf1 subunit/transcription initiation factor TFIIB
MRKLRDFSARSPAEQQMLTEDSWCDLCDEADLGMRDAKEFDEDGKIVIEGLCVKCGSVIRNHLTDIGTAQPKSRYEEEA